MIEALNLEEFMALEGTVFDVRSPSEYQQGRIPGSINLPLFSDAERAQVGTTYKMEGKEQAISLGMKYTSPKVSRFVTQAKQHLNSGTAKIHCWRGGMRSSAMAMLLENTGIPSVTLQSGYKTFRGWAHELFEKPYRYNMLGGLTGSGKTSILHALEGLGEQVIDLEGLAHHRGSAFGHIGRGEQPSTEQFFNEISIKLGKFDVERPIWVENESRQIGFCHIPEALFSSMQKAPLYLIERPLEERIATLCCDYGNTDPKKLIEATLCIKKKLGGARTKEVIGNISEGQLKQAVGIILEYYDSTYTFGLTRRKSPIHKLSEKNFSAKDWAEKLLSNDRGQ
ncbi:MAG: tRNA 2-selenouridine synthase [Chlamydiae bacterium]|nr:tRNA 2-selenouridine synthase [Chlamydiota bacterium]